MDASPCRVVLIVDDDPAIRETLAAYLELHGVATAAAANGREALDYLHPHPPPTLIILDLMMPVMDGWRFRDLQLQDPALAGIPIFLCSAVADKYRHGAFQEAVAVEKKPVDPERIVEAVRRLG